jgi:Asp-tRNA(Asn)/Glu-tRNA(Gln) amidotransferase A subunit family amidase
MAGDIEALFESEDGIGLAALVRRRAISADELLTAALSRIARVEPELQSLTRIVASPPPRRSPARSRACPSWSRN